MRRIPDPLRAAAYAAACAFALCTVSPSFSAEPASETRAAGSQPRIGLALSGGGARGIAHIGVLKVLEELRVPVHCITGTSMGAIVGAGFASGTTPARLEERVLKTDWDSVFTDRPPRQEIAQRRKTDDYKTLFAPELGVKDGGLALPKGILSGIAIESYFRGLTETAADITDFQKLPIPFRAVAADIETGEAVVLDRGSISQTMRASMSVPGAMVPVEINGRLLVDGGIANNLPIDEARKLCADIIIAVDISTPPLKREQIKSALTVSAQLINFLGKATVEQQVRSLTDRDMLISPKLGDITAGSFDRAKDLIRIGEEATRAAADGLRRYSLPSGEYAALRARQTTERTDLAAVDEIRFEGLQRTNPEVLRSLVRTKPGEPLSEEQIAADLRRIYGRGDFESVDYRIVQEPGTRALVIQPREKAWGPDYLRFGVGLATDFQGEAPFTLLAQYRRTWLNRLGGEWLSEVQIGRENRLFTEFYQPVDQRGRWFVAPNASAGRTTRGVFVGEDRVAEYDVKYARLGVDGGLVLGTWGELRMGPLWQRIDAEVDTGSRVLPTLEETSAGVQARLFADQLDNPFFPRGGYRIAGSAYIADNSLGSDRDYKRFEADLTAAKSWGPHTLNVNFRGGTDAHSNTPAYETFTLGGPLRLSGYRINEFSGQRMTFGRVMYYNRVLPLPSILGSGVYVGGSLEAGAVHGRFDGLPSKGTVVSGSVFLAAETFAGPAFFGLGAGESGRWSLYLLLGVP